MGLRMSQVNPDSIDEIVARMEDERILFDDWPEFHYRLFEFACLTAEKEGYRPVMIPNRINDFMIDRMLLLYFAGLQERKQESRIIRIPTPDWHMINEKVRVDYAKGLRWYQDLIEL